MTADANILAVTQLIMDGLVTIFGLGFLMLYSVLRRFKNEKPKTMMERLDRWRIEIIFAAVLVPQWADWFPKLIPKIFTGG